MVGGGDIEQVPEALSVTVEGRAWLGDALADRVATSTSTVNRALVGGEHIAGHVALVTGVREDFVGALPPRRLGLLVADRRLLSQSRS